MIRKPDYWKHSPGDWIFIRVPDIAMFEWHPFTISSAPERPGAFTLHIRAAGNWTNRLYEYYEAIKAKYDKKLRSEAIKR